MPNPTSIAMADEWAKPDDKQDKLSQAQQRLTQKAIRNLAEAITNIGTNHQVVLAQRIIDECHIAIKLAPSDDE